VSDGRRRSGAIASIRGFRYCLFGTFFSLSENHPVRCIYSRVIMERVSHRPLFELGIRVGKEAKAKDE
jgi:hypothetical protein